MILVTGATGNVGGHVVGRLCAAGVPVRALVRSPERADNLRGYDCETAIGSFEDPGSLRRAVRDVDRVLLVVPASPQLPEQAGALLDAVESSGERPAVVALSVVGVDGSLPDNRIVDAHRSVASRLAGSGLPHTLLAPVNFFQNLLGSTASVQEAGAIYGPYADGRVPYVDAADVAAVAAHVLTSDGHAHSGATYTLSGPEALTMSDVARRLGEVVGREVRYVDVPPEAARESMLGAGMSEWLADGLLEFAAATRDGTMETFVTDEVKKATGRPPRRLEDFVAAHRAAFG